MYYPSKEKQNRSGLRIEKKMKAWGEIRKFREPPQPRAYMFIGINRTTNGIDFFKHLQGLAWMNVPTECQPGFGGGMKI